jgi:hypothetical protein
VFDFISASVPEPRWPPCASGPSSADLLFPFTTPFLDDPATGNLVLDLQIEASGSALTFDTVSGDPAIGRVFSAGSSTATFEFLTIRCMSDIVTDMKVNSRDFQRDFARMKAKAAAGETVYVVSDGEQFVFQAVKPITWQGALKGKAKISGDLFSTGLDWETSR